jgi:hypothetical protein
VCVCALWRVRCMSVWCCATTSRCRGRPSSVLAQLSAAAPAYHSAASSHLWPSDAPASDFVLWVLLQCVMLLRRGRRYVGAAVSSGIKLSAEQARSSAAVRGVAAASQLHVSCGASCGVDRRSQRGLTTQASGAAAFGVPTLKGRCKCGSVGWDAAGPSSINFTCHCSVCRKASGRKFIQASGFKPEMVRREGCCALLCTVAQ